MSSKKPAVGLFVGRFQPMHNGHLDAIKYALKHAGKLVVIIGSAQFSRESHNPLTADERAEMVRDVFMEEGIKNYEIVKVDDLFHPKKWVSEIKSRAKFDVIFSTNPWTVKCFNEAGMEVKPHAMRKKKLLNGSEIRRRMREGEQWEDLVPPAAVRFLKRKKLLEVFKSPPGHKQNK